MATFTGVGHLESDASRGDRPLVLEVPSSGMIKARIDGRLVFTASRSEVEMIGHADGTVLISRPRGDNLVFQPNRPHYFAANVLSRFAGSEDSSDRAATVVPTTPAGWYDDPDKPGMQRYWDGTQWLDHWQPRPPSTPRPPPPPPPQPSPYREATRETFRPLSGGLTGTLVGFLWAAAAFSAVAAVLFLVYWDSWREWFGPGFSSITFQELLDVEAVALGWQALSLVVGLPAAVLFIIWHNLAYKSAETVRSDLKWSSGWAVGGWFIPLANLVIPKLVMNQVEVGALTRETQRERRSGRSSPLPALGSWWWGLWVGGIVVGAIGGGVLGYADFEFNSELYDDGLMWRAAGFGVSAVAGVLAALYVRAIGKRLK